MLLQSGTWKHGSFCVYEKKNDRLCSPEASQKLEPFALLYFLKKGVRNQDSPVMSLNIINTV